MSHIVCVIPVTAVAGIDYTELLAINEHYIALNMCEVLSVKFLKTLNYFIKSLLRGKYETIY